MKELFISLLNSTKRNGIADLINYLEDETDFFIAPASANHHGNLEKGLLQHSLDVYYNFKFLCNNFDKEISEESIIIISLLHDVCKTNFYELSKKSLPDKDEKGNLKLDRYGKKIWIEKEVYSINDNMPLGHGEKSVIILQKYIQLTNKELFSIRWHMMSYDDSTKSYAGNLALTKALDLFPVISLIHCADLLSISHPIKKEQNKKEDIDKIFFQDELTLRKENI